jgi:hypothetical protein
MGQQRPLLPLLLPLLPPPPPLLLSTLPTLRMPTCLSCPLTTAAAQAGVSAPTAAV